MRNLFVLCNCFFEKLVSHLKNFKIIQRPASQANTPELSNSCPSINKDLRDRSGSFEYHHFRDMFNFADIDHGYSIAVCQPCKAFVHSCAIKFHSADLCCFMLNYFHMMCGEVFFPCFSDHFAKCVTHCPFNGIKSVIQSIEKINNGNLK